MHWHTPLSLSHTHTHIPLKTHYVAADSTGRICSSSPSPPARCWQASLLQTPVFHPSSRPSACSPLPPSPSSYPPLKRRISPASSRSPPHLCSQTFSQSLPCIWTHTRLSKFVEWLYHTSSFSPSRLLWKPDTLMHLPPTCSNNTIQHHVWFA